MGYCGDMLFSVNSNYNKLTVTVSVMHTLSALSRSQETDEHKIALPVLLSCLVSFLHNYLCILKNLQQLRKPIQMY